MLDHLAEKLKICCKVQLTADEQSRLSKKLTNTIEQDYYVLYIKQMDIHGRRPRHRGSNILLTDEFLFIVHSEPVLSKKLVELSLPELVFVS